MPAQNLRLLSIANILQISISILLGALFWPLVCFLCGAYGEPDPIVEVAVTSALIAGAVGGSVGWLVAWSFGAGRGAITSRATISSRPSTSVLGGSSRG